MLIDFHLICQQPVHDEESIRVIDIYLKKFHEAKEVFLRFRVGKRGANAGKKAVDDWLLETFGEIPGAGDPRLRQLTAHQKAERALCRHKAETEASRFNFPKLYLCGHFSSTVRLFGNLLNWSTEITESLYKL